jgi:hypothetical protein
MEVGKIQWNPTDAWTFKPHFSLGACEGGCRYGLRDRGVQYREPRRYFFKHAGGLE